jgi:hypothetical protein
MTRMLSNPPASLSYEPDQKGAPEQRKRRLQQPHRMTREKQLALVEEARAARLEQPARREGN